MLQLLAGVSLGDVLAQEFPRGMNERLALDVIAPVVGVLERLHEPWRLRNGRTWHCIYQDLKPANILIDPLGRPTLLDFGGCQVVVDGVPVLEGACTPGYAPPDARAERASCSRVPTSTAIGSTLYHMLTGVDPRERFRSRVGPPGSPLDPGALPGRISPDVRRPARTLPRPAALRADGRRSTARATIASLMETGRTDSPPRKLPTAP